MRVAMYQYVRLMIRKKLIDRLLIDICDHGRLLLMQLALQTHIRNHRFAFFERACQKSSLPFGLPDLRAELLIRQVVGTQLVAVRNKIALAGIVKNMRIGQYRRLRRSSKFFTDQKIAIAGYPE